MDPNDFANDDPHIRPLFIGVFPGGVSYADRRVERDGDYKRCAFLPFGSLELEIDKRCSPDLKDAIIADAASIQARRGQSLRVSTCGQTVTLGE